MDDTEIAIRLGHRSGADLVQKTYGIAEPNWCGKGLQDRLPEPVADTAYKAWLGTPLDTSLFSKRATLGNSSPLLPVSNLDWLAVLWLETYFSAGSRSSVG